MKIQKMLVFLFMFGFSVFFVSRVLANNDMSPIDYETIFFDKLNKEGTVDFLEIKHNSNGWVNFVDEGVKMEAVSGGAGTLNFDFGDIENEDIVISVEMFDDGEEKVSYAEVQGLNKDTDVDVRFYFGVIEEEGNAGNEYCLGNSIGNINDLEKKRRCLPMGINRQPRTGKWIPVKFFITRIGTYGVVDGIPSFIFGRSENEKSLSGQTEGLFTPLIKIDKFVIANKTDNASSSVLWRNLKIEKIKINSSKTEDHVFSVVDKYSMENPDPFPADMFANDLGLRYRYIADDLLVRAVKFLKTSDFAHLEYIQRVVADMNEQGFVDDIARDAGNGNPLIRMRPGQAIYSLGMVYKLTSNDLNSDSLNKLRIMVESGVDILFEDVKFGNGQYDCAVQQNPGEIFDTRAEENIWKLKGLSVGLLMPGYNAEKKNQLRQSLDGCLKETFSYENDLSRPQYPGWNINSDWTVANHGYKPNPSYGLCSVSGNMLDVDLAIRYAEKNGFDVGDSMVDYVNDVVGNIWDGHSYLVGISNRDGDKYINQADFLFFPKVKKEGQSSFSYAPVAKQSGVADINWYRGIDDWGTSGRWCTSGVYMAEKSLKSLGKETYGDFEYMALMNLYLQDISITYPDLCYFGESNIEGGYRCVYSLDTMNDPSRKRGLDLKQAHRNSLIWLSMNDDLLTSCVLSEEADIGQIITWYTAYRSGSYKVEADLNCDNVVNVSDLVSWYGRYRNN